MSPRLPGRKTSTLMMVRSSDGSGHSQDVPCLFARLLIEGREGAQTNKGKARGRQEAVQFVAKKVPHVMGFFGIDGMARVFDS